MTQRKSSAEESTGGKSRASKKTTRKSTASKSSARKSTTSKTSAAKTSASKTSASKTSSRTVSKELRELIDELAEARERAGRAEARAELLSLQLADESSQDTNSARVETLKDENRVLRERVEFLQEQTEELRRRLIAAELDSATGEASEEPLVPPEEEDEFLAMTQRWRARRKRRRFARREAKAAKRLRTS